MPEHILNAQAVRVFLPTNDAPVLRPCSEATWASAVIGFRSGGVLGLQTNIHLDLLRDVSSEGSASRIAAFAF
jgi:hypothetical protein